MLTDKQQLDIIRTLFEKSKDIMVPAGVTPVAWIVGLTEELGGMLAAQGLSDEEEAFSKLFGSIRECYDNALEAIETARAEREEDCDSYVSRVVAKAVAKGEP